MTPTLETKPEAEPDSVNGRLKPEAHADSVNGRLKPEARADSVNGRLKPEARPDSVNGRLAKCLNSQRTDIINEWLERVRKDPAIPTDSMTLLQVQDHLPHLFDDLTDTLSRYGSEAVAAQSEEDGEKHGADRWEQGFELPEMLRELTHLRSILIHRLGLFEARNDDFGLVSRLFVTTTLHGFLDRMGINATEQFLKQGLRERESAAEGSS